MSKKRNYEKSLLRNFADNSDMELTMFIKFAIRDYKRKELALEKAKEILKKYGFDGSGYVSLDYEKSRLGIVLDIAKLRNIAIDSEWYNVLITDIDVIEMIDNIRYGEIKFVNEHSYLYDCVNDAEKAMLEECKDESVPDEWPSEIEEDRIIEQYRIIMIEQFGFDLVNQYDKKLENDRKRSLSKIKTIGKHKCYVWW